MRRPRSRRLRAVEVREADPGDYVELVGELRASDPIEGPLSGRELVGYQVLCSVFQAGPRGGMPEFDERVDAERWSSCVLVDDSGDVEITLRGSTLRVPVLAEDSLTDAAEIAAMLRRLDLSIDDPPEQLQLLERGVLDGASVHLTGRVAEPPLTQSAYRRSAKPRLRIVGVRGAPLVITPR